MLTPFRLVACSLAFLCSVASAYAQYQFKTPQVGDLWNAYDKANAEQLERSRQRREASIAKRQRNMLLQQHAKLIVPLDSSQLAQWEKVSNARGSYYQYAIKRNKGTIAMAYFNPKIGYVVNDRFQENGLGWLTLDEAIKKQFRGDEIFGLPDIPGWSKSHELTSDEHLAEMKRQAMVKAKGKAVDKIADNVADGIVEKVGPKINQGIGQELGVDMPKTAAKVLQFKRKQIVDPKKQEFIDQSGRFLIVHQRSGEIFEVSQRKNNAWQQFEEVFATMEDAINFASLKAEEMQPALNKDAPAARLNVRRDP